MKFDWKTPIRGIPPIELRNFLKQNFPLYIGDGITLEGVVDKLFLQEMRNSSWLWTESLKDRKIKIENIKNDARERCRQLIQACLEGGFIEIRKEIPLDRPSLQTHGVDEDPKPATYYTLTDLGGDFRNASPRRFSRAAAQRQLDFFLDRCRDVNARPADITDPISLCCVQTVKLYGSFARGEENVGDLDLMMDIAFKDPDLATAYNTEILNQGGLEGFFRSEATILARRYLLRGLTILRTTPHFPKEWAPPPNEILDCGISYP